MSPENLSMIVLSIGDARQVADMLPEGYKLADMYIRVRQPARAAEMLRLVAVSLRDLAEKTDAIAASIN